MADANVYTNADGSFRAELPNFATELTLEQIAVHTGASKQILTSIMRGNSMTGSELKKMHEQVKLQVAQFQGLRSENKDANNKLDATLKATAKSTADAVKKSGSDVYKAMMKNNNTMQGVVQPFLDGASGVLGAMTKNIPVLGKIVSATSVAATATASFALGIADEFRAQAQLLASEVGGGLYDNMLELRTAAGSAGLFLRDLSSMAQQSGTAIAQLGDNVDDGLRNVSRLSFGFRQQTRQFGNFGLTVEELNALMIEEIDIMSAMGKSQRQMTNNLNSTNGGLNTLLFESTALARMTGQNRREMIQSSMAIQKDTIGRLRLAQMNDEERAEFTRTQTFAQGALGSELGSTLVNIANRAAAQGISVEQALAADSPGLMEANQLLGGQLGDFMNAILSNDREGMLSIAQALGPQISANQTQLAQLAGLGGMESAGQLLDLAAGLAQRLDNLSTRTEGTLDPGLGQAQALGLVGADLRAFQAEFLTRLANTNILGLGFRPGDAEATAEFTRNLISGVGSALGIDANNADLTTGFGATAQALVTAFLAGQLELPGGQGGGGAGGGTLGGLVAGAAGGLATRIGAGALTMTGGLLATIGLPALVITGALATVAAGAYFFSKSSEKKKDEHFESMRERFDDLSKGIRDGTLTAEEQLKALDQLNAIMEEANKMGRDEAIKPFKNELVILKNMITANQASSGNPINRDAIDEQLQRALLALDRGGMGALDYNLNLIDAQAQGAYYEGADPEILKRRLRAQAASRKMQDAIAGLGTSGQQAISDKNNLAGMLMDMFSSQVGTDVEIFERNLGQNKGLIDAILGADMSKGNSVPNLLQEILDTLNLSQETHLKQFQTVESDRYSKKSENLN